MMHIVSLSCTRKTLSLLVAVSTLSCFCLFPSLAIELSTPPLVIHPAVGNKMYQYYRLIFDISTFRPRFLCSVLATCVAGKTNDIIQVYIMPLQLLCTQSPHTVHMMALSPTAVYIKKTARVQISSHFPCYYQQPE